MRRFREESGASDTFTFPDLVLRWETLVESLEARTYLLSFSDYVHDLQQREAVETICRVLPDRYRNDVASLLTHLDSRFRLATREMEQPLLDAEASAFWWRRMPKSVGTEFREEMASRGD
jgi:hypothetical protein